MERRCLSSGLGGCILIVQLTQLSAERCRAQGLLGPFPCCQSLCSQERAASLGERPWRKPYILKAKKGGNAASPGLEGELKGGSEPDAEGSEPDPVMSPRAPPAWSHVPGPLSGVLSSGPLKVTQFASSPQLGHIPKETPCACGTFCGQLSPSDSILVEAKLVSPQGLGPL